MKAMLRRSDSIGFRAGLVAWVSTFSMIVVILLILVGIGKLRYATEEGNVVDSAAYHLRQGATADQAWASAQEWSESEDFQFVIYGEDDEPIFTAGDGPDSVVDLAELRAVSWLSLSKVDVSDETWSVGARSQVTPTGENYVISYAHIDEHPWVEVLLLWAILLTPAVLVAAIPAGIAAVAVNRSLKRVDGMATEMQQISLGSLGRRVPSSDRLDPIDRLAHVANRMFERLESAQKHQSQFVADASHELRSPIAGLMMQLEVAEQYPDQVDLDELLSHLTFEAERMNRVVADLLELSHLDAERQTSVGVLPIGAAEEIVNVEVERLRDRHRHLQIELDQADRSGFSEDRGAVLLTENGLERLLQNLGSNAARHSSSAIRIVVRISAEAYEIVVMDDGPGIAEVDRQRVFDRFVRLDDARSPDEGGSGLGLALCRDLVTHSGGEIQIVDSTVKGFDGTTVTVKLPLVAERELAVGSF